ncbi:MAG TPA: TIGR03016 family PEP-CTERM system-associated outer membrane protein [Casimicrobiaceae bacterium]|nr:TIGR03016 family PEP-CTERM system-associated outer membrane protein [Casimicrobiaceae bacterium]
MTVAVLALEAPAALAQTWRIVPTVSLESTLTDNVNLAPSDRRQSDWVNELTPGIGFDETGSHTKLNGRIALPMLVYARTSENNYVAPEAAVTGTLEAIDKLFFIDASANVSQQYLSPFGARSSSLANSTQNRYTSQLYSVSPYIKGNSPGGIDYELRQKNTWTNASGISAAPSADRSYTNEITTHVARAPQPAGWRFEYDYSDITFPGQQRFNNETTQIGRGIATYQPDPELGLFASAGYEDNKFFFNHESGVTYGGGVEWHPTDRTTLNARAEHRFFGASYNVSFDHRTPLTVWSVKAVRDMTTYPEQLATLPAGADVAAMLDFLFASRVQDPAQRQAIVDQVIHDRGLPLFLSSPVALFTSQTTLVESETATFGILGARNSILLTAYRMRNEPITGSPSETLPPLLSQLLNNTQVGTNVVWTHQLEPGLALNVSGDWSHTTDNAAGGGTTRLYSLNAKVARALSGLTSLYAGMRYQDSHSDVTTDYREAAVFVGVTHTFR